ncbi:MAG: helix-turn-helix transcriptional regulator [Hyphomicrobium sp.]
MTPQRKSSNTHSLVIVTSDGVVNTIETDNMILIEDDRRATASSREASVLSRQDVMERTGLTALELYHAHTRAEFPKSLSNGQSWLESDIDAWIASRPVMTDLPPFEEFK